MLALLLGALAASALAASALAAPNNPLQEGVDPPADLYATGLFRPPGATPTPELRPYDIQQALWVDFAQKERYLYLPPGQKIEFSPGGAYGFPVGAVLTKHFRMEISRGVYRDLETRLLVKKESGWVGFTYQWSGGGATLVNVQDSPVVSMEIDATALGGARHQNFQIPSRRQCLQCHNSSVGFVRSVQTRQLNRGFKGMNQLDAWNKDRLFQIDIGPSAQYDSFAPIAEVSLPLEKRIRAYVDVNCAHCHNPDPAAMCSFTGLDFRADYLDPEVLVASGHLKRGSKEESDIYRRMSSLLRGERMPFIGSILKDEAALTAVGEWIDGFSSESALRPAAVPAAVSPKETIRSQ